MLLTLLGETFRICCCLLEAVDGEAMPEGVRNIEIYKQGSEACSAVREVMAAVVWADSLVVLVGNSDGAIIDSAGCCWSKFPLPSCRGSKSDTSTVSSCIGKRNTHAMMLPPPTITTFKQTCFRLTS
jgi:hypothetical protein